MNYPRIIAICVLLLTAIGCEKPAKEASAPVEEAPTVIAETSAPPVIEAPQQPPVPIDEWFRPDETYNPEVIKGVWTNREEGKRRFTSSSHFSWGENAYSTDSLIIDLNDEEGLELRTYGGERFLVQETQSEGNQILLTGYYTIEGRGDKAIQREILITLLDENTMVIELRGMERLYFLPWPFPEENPNDYYYRVPVDTPVEPWNWEDGL